MVKVIFEVTINNRLHRIHPLRTLEPYFSDIKSGAKTFEVRKFDRDYRVGDFLRLRQYNPETGEYGDSALKEITYLRSNNHFI